MSEQPDFKYLIYGEQDELWGITVDNVGEYFVAPRYAVYPPRVGHPNEYDFDVSHGRVLDNYQLIYISRGRGWYHSANQKIEVRSGSMLIIPPYTWHSYYPDQKTGWQEHWIGMRGKHIDERYRNGFFSQDKVIHYIGFREYIIDQYKEAIELAIKEKPGYQQLLAAIANNILASVIYYDRNGSYSNDLMADKINLARSIMRENVLNEINLEEVAEKINMSYSWFRKTFKEYTNLSPAHYMVQLKLQKAKSMLLNSTMSVKEISFLLNYEDAAYFSSIFKKYIGCTPSEYKAAAMGEAGKEEDTESESDPYSI